MARITKKQEFDELAKFGCAFMQTNSYGGYCIVIHEDGEYVLWRDCTSRYEHTAQRWQRIKRTVPRDENAESRPYLTIYGCRYYIDQFMRCS